MGSGTKLALEDAIELARCIGDSPGDLGQALRDYEAVRSVEVLKIQNAARNSTEWFENVERYAHLPPEQFAYSLLTRSQRISHENLRLRDKDYVEDYEDWIAERSGVRRSPLQHPVPPMFTPFTVRGITLKNRVVVSPMAQYSCVDGHAGRLPPGAPGRARHGRRRHGGGGDDLPDAGCPHHARLPRPVERGAARWLEAHRRLRARRTPTRRSPCSWGTRAPRARPACRGKARTSRSCEGNWPLISASPQQYLDGVSDWSRAMTRADMDRVRHDFVHSTRLAAEAGFDWLELHCAHGYLLSSFISPLTNQRTDEYGGSLENRLRYPLEVFRAMRAVWPQHLPMSVRISAHDWVEGGITPDDAVEIARAFKAAGADMIDCSSGQVSKQQKPVYGRMYQTPFADRIRNEAGIADHRRGRDLGSRPRQQHHRRRPRRPVRRGAARTWPIRPGRCWRRPRSATWTCSGPSSTGRPRPSWSATWSARRPTAAQALQPIAGDAIDERAERAPGPGPGRGQPQAAGRLPGPHFLWQVKDAVATITLNRPERKNPLTFDSYAELRDLFGQLKYADRRARRGGRRRRRQLLLGRRRARDHRPAGAR